MACFIRWLPGLAALLVSAFGSFLMLMAYTTPNGVFGILLALPIMLVGVVLGFLQTRQWAGIAAMVIPVVMFNFLYLHGPFCHQDL